MKWQLFYVAWLPQMYNRWHILRRKPCQLPGWMKISSYYSATAGIRTSDLPHRMTMSKKVPCSYSLSHRSCSCIVVRALHRKRPPQNLNLHKVSMFIGGSSRR